MTLSKQRDATTQIITAYSNKQVVKYKIFYLIYHLLIGNVFHFHAVLEGFFCFLFFCFFSIGFEGISIYHIYSYQVGWLEDCE